ncbi:MAG: transglycosylase domain-containing protein [Verrucomicrobiota bacterium]
MPTATSTRPPVSAASTRSKPKPARDRRKSASRKRGFFNRLFRSLLWGVAYVLGAGLIVGGITLGFYSFMAGQYDLEVIEKHLADAEVNHSVDYTAPDGRETRRLAVPLEDMSPHFVNALLVREDLRFYDHNGVDFRGVARSVLRNAKERRLVQGASTITMQLARNSFDDLALDRSLHRKLIEAFLARRIEKNFTKEEIFEVYANMVYFGGNLHGVERASLAFFGKSSRELSLSEAAMLAGIIRGPNAFSPLKNYERALAERDVVLDRMVEEGYITKEESVAAKSENPAVLKTKTPRRARVVR